MDAEEFEIKLADLESRIRYIEQDQQDNQGQNAQLPPFVPIPQIQNDASQKPFDIVNGKVTNCRIACPVTEKTCGDYTIEGDNPIYLHVDRNSNGDYQISVNQTSRVKSSSHIEYCIYTFTNTGDILCDSRISILPVFDT